MRFTNAAALAAAFVLITRTAFGQTTNDTLTAHMICYDSNVSPKLAIGVAIVTLVGGETVEASKQAGRCPKIQIWFSGSVDGKLSVISSAGRRSAHLRLVSDQMGIARYIIVYKDDPQDLQRREISIFLGWKRGEISFK